jgi:hypothetical protein
MTLGLEVAILVLFNFLSWRIYMVAVEILRREKVYRHLIYMVLKLCMVIGFRKYAASLVNEVFIFILFLSAVP